MGRRNVRSTETLMALHELQMPAVMLWPNVDAGSEDVSRGMRKFRENYKPEYIRFYKNFPVETYLRLMRSAACLVGNSSASIREGAFVGTPAVNIGSRQDGRERAPNVIDVGHDRKAIADAIRRQVEHGRFPPAHLYGDGQAGPRIAEVLARTTLGVQKRIQYLNVLGVIPARGGSKGIPRKNLAPLAGRPLLAYTTDAALASSRLTRVVVSTDDEEIAGVSRQLGVEVPFLRSQRLAADETPMLDVLIDLVAALQRARTVPARPARAAAAHVAVSTSRAHRRGRRSADVFRGRFGGHRSAGPASVHALVPDALAGRPACRMGRRAGANRDARTNRSCLHATAPPCWRFAHRSSRTRDPCTARTRAAS